MFDMGFCTKAKRVKCAHPDAQDLLKDILHVRKLCQVSHSE